MRLPILLALPVFCLASVSAQASQLSVTARLVDTQPKAKPDRDPQSKNKKKGKEDHTQTEQRRINVSIRNVSRQEHPDAKVRFFFFGRTVGEPQLQILENEEKPLAIGAGATVSAESKDFSATYTEAHPSKQKGSATRQKASGTRITGFGVKVVEGEVVLGEYFSSNDAKALADKPAGT